MSTSEAFDQLVSAFAATGTAHHQVDDDPDHLWADWYARHLIEDVNEILDTNLTVGQLSDWLIEADRRYSSQSEDSSWPEAYAGWILHQFAG